MGFVLALIGLQKIIEPYQNFLHVIQGYKLFSPFWENVIARIFPWCEVFLGVFLVLGLWLNWILKAYLILFSSLIIIVIQAILRDLPIETCGCFGESLSLSLTTMFVVDCGLLVATALLLHRIDQTGTYSLDSYFGEK
jgi:hypothetical protein